MSSPALTWIRNRHQNIQKHPPSDCAVSIQRISVSGPCRRCCCWRCCWRCRAGGAFSLQSPCWVFICILDQIIITLCMPRTSLSVMDDWCSRVISTKVLCPASYFCLHQSGGGGDRKRRWSRVGLSVHCSWIYNVQQRLLTIVESADALDTRVGVCVKKRSKESEGLRMWDARI